MAFGEDALSLLDHNPAIEGVLKLVGTSLCPCDPALLQDANRGHVGERLCKLDVILVEGAQLVAVELQGTDAVVSQA